MVLTSSNGLVGKIIEKDIPLINLIKPSQEFILLRTMKE